MPFCSFFPLEMHAAKGQVVMVVYQAIGMTTSDTALHDVSQDGEKQLPVLGICIDRLPGIAARRPMVERPGVDETKRTGHRRESIVVQSTINT
jgi:hypothetical protein